MTFDAVWTNEYEDCLKANYLDGKSSAEVAIIINRNFGTNFSRSAIIGKLKRLKITRKPAAAVGNEPLKNHNFFIHKPPAKSAKMPKLREAVITDLVYPKRAPYKLPEAGQCKYIIGEIDTGHICQASRGSHPSYCTEHQKLVSGGRAKNVDA